MWFLCFPLVSLGRVTSYGSVSTPVSEHLAAATSQGQGRCAGEVPRAYLALGQQEAVRAAYHFLNVLIL